MSKHRTRFAIPAMLALASISTPAAAQFTYTVYAGAAWSDNITLANDGETVGQAALIPGLDFSWNREGADLEAHVTGNLEYHYYPDSSFDSQTQVLMSGQAFWTLAPRRFGIAIADYASVQPVNRLANDTPSNQQQTNVFSLSPVLRFRLGELLLGRVELRHVISTAEQTQAFDSRRTRLALALTRELDATSQLSFNVAAGRVDLDHNERAPDYTRQDVFVGYHNSVAHLELSAALGGTRIFFDRTGLPSQSGTLARLGLDWHLSTHNTLGLSGRRQLGDAVENMMLGPPGTDLDNPGGITTGSAVINGQVFVERAIELAWTYQGQRAGFSITPHYRTIDYVNLSRLDRTARGAYLTFDMRVRPNLTLAASTSWEDFRYDTLDRQDKASMGMIGIRYQRNRHWSWRANLSYRHRSSTTVGANYHETRLYVGVSYQR